MADALAKSGGTMTGQLFLSGDPVSPDEAATKAYVDAAVGGAATGTVTSVSVTTANGVSGSVANSTTTPAITLSLGAITPTSVNSVVVSGSSTPTLAVSGTSTVSGANTGDETTATIKTKLGITTLSGSNTGDQTTSNSDSTITVSNGSTNPVVSLNLNHANTWTQPQTVSQLIDSGLTASTVPYADSSKQLTSSSVTPTELGYLSGVTSAIQTQINSFVSGLTQAQALRLVSLRA